MEKKEVRSWERKRKEEVNLMILKERKKRMDIARKKKEMIKKLTKGGKIPKESKTES